MVRDPKTGYHVASAIEHVELWRELRSIEQDPIVSSWLDDPNGDDFRTRRMVDAATAGAVIAFARPGDATSFPWSEVEAAIYARVPVLVVGFDGIAVPPEATRFDTLAAARRAAKDLLKATAQAEAEVDESVAWARLKWKERDVLAEYDRGNLTGLGVANALLRIGFSSRYAADVANGLAARPPEQVDADWIMVPRQRSPEMIAAASNIGDGLELTADQVLSVYDAMVGAILGRAHASKADLDKAEDKSLEP